MSGAAADDSVNDDGDAADGDFSNVDINAYE
jgi:hypothetical protein